MIVAMVQNMLAPQGSPVVVVLDDTAVVNLTKAKQLVTTMRSTIRGVAVGDPEPIHGRAHGHAIFVRTTAIDAVVEAIEALA